MVLSLVIGSAAHAVTVKTIEGNVQINRGNGYESVRRTAQAKVGESVMVSPDGVAQIIYEDGCTVTVEEGNVVLVGEQSPCVEQATADGGGLLGAGHLFIIVPVVGAIVGLVFLLKGDDEPPASP